MEQRRHYNDGQRQRLREEKYYTDGSTARQVAPEKQKGQHRNTENQSDMKRQHAQMVRAQRAQRAQQTSDPDRRPTHHTQKQMERQTAQLQRQRQVNQRVAMQNREKALRIDWKYMTFLCVAVVAVLASCVLYLTMQTKLSQKNNEISKLRSDLSIMTDANLATKERINDALDLEFVKKYATEQLGMVYPTEKQIVTYKSSDEDYVKQYQDIPQSTN